MKPFFLILGIIVFAHYFFLTQITVSATEAFIGKVSEVKEIDKGLFRRAEVSFEVPEFLHGDLIKEKRIINMVYNELVQFKVGKTYTVKTHKNWLCHYSKS